MTYFLQPVDFLNILKEQNTSHISRPRGPGGLSKETGQSSLEKSKNHPLDHQKRSSHLCHADLVMGRGIPKEACWYQLLCSCYLQDLQYSARQEELATFSVEETKA